MSSDRVNDQHERFATWDAAYALGALSASDRAQYEAHLAGCARCRAAVAELTPAVGLLSRLNADAVASGAGDIDADDTAAAGVKLLDIARARRRTRRRRTWAAVGIAAAIAIAVPVGVVALSPRPAVSVALEQVVPVQVDAEVELTSLAWGTRIDMACDYGADAPDEGWTYVLAVVGADGAESDLSTWRVEPGRTARLSAGTALAIDDIRAVEIRTAAGEVLLRTELG
ncbi:zf-HC2 domain-containing protein [Microbacterium sp. H1-D42]|uniref:zf-HC2 domain-containing protein n=1 Tax=Microbacterium sp. H1-D42 TaxID=2925844 RepID=UPI001F5383E4|nr:zf-HC2 domain-containing protein [Microbacterium sp. H1-D42]UNK69862.1 zf-HC2 domain-containing protein [Microbacterium sp. H1-D42]